MTFKDLFSQQLKMIPLENTFKQLHEQFPERNLQLPHSGEYVSDILKLASQKTSNSFPDKLLENRLEEELFFRTGGDPEVFDFVFYAYREFPAYFQEILWNDAGGVPGEDVGCKESKAKLEQSERKD